MTNVVSKRKGFTLAELVVVITILGILLLIAVSRFSSISDSANVRTFEANHRVVVSAIQLYMADHNGALPPDTSAAAPGAPDPLAPYIGEADGATTGLGSLVNKPNGATYVWVQSTKTLTSSFTKSDGIAETRTYTP